VIFTDFKAAYDSVDHRILFEKMWKMGFSSDLINTIIKFYSSAKTKIGDKVIYVRRGVLQGNLFSPLLFNIYIDDLVRELSFAAFDMCGYADDLVSICKDLINLKNCVNILDKWSKENGIGINYKKSGIMLLKGDNKGAMKELLGYPLVKKYKYLGVLINNKMNCPDHIHVITGKLNKYFSRNK
jgi:hypothetical protein